MAHRSPSGAEPALAANRDVTHVPVPRRGHHRSSAPTVAWQGRATLAAVLAGAAVAGGHTMLSEQPPLEYSEIDRVAAGGLIQSTSPRVEAAPSVLAAGPTLAAPEISVADSDTDVADVQSLTKAVQVGERLATDAGRVRSALSGGASSTSVFNGVQFVRPVTGTLTSGFGGRWGTTHYGVDIANRIGTPIYSVTDGVVVDSGPASGFGLWVKVLHPSGFTSVYGHINRSLVTPGQRVKAGQKIAEMGNRGHSTGPHLHLEIWDPNGRKINPVAWLLTRGISVTGGPSADRR